MTLPPDNALLMAGKPVNFTVESWAALGQNTNRIGHKLAPIDHVDGWMKRWAIPPSPRNLLCRRSNDSILRWIG